MDIICKNRIKKKQNNKVQQKWKKKGGNVKENGEE
jgi:hypothetical protein